MSARITLESALEQLEALRHNITLVETERDSLRDEVAKLRAARPAVRPAYTPRPASPEQLAIRAAMAAAKAQAMRTGRSVLVGEQ